MASSSSSSSSEPIGCHATLHVSAVACNADGYLISITVTEAECLPVELFVFQRRPLEEGASRDEFRHVTSLADIEEYEVGAPRPGATCYRLATVDLVFRNISLLFHSLRELKRDVCLLVESASANLVLTASQFVVDEDGVVPVLVWDEDAWGSGKVWGP